MKAYVLGLIILMGIMVIPQSAMAAPSSLVQTVRVEHVATKGGKNATFVIPGIGQGEIRCQQRATWIKFQPYNRNLETNFWSSKYEMKNGEWSAAVKNARVYRYANADDDGKGGTGATAREGLNKFFNQYHGVENDAQGYLYGVFSQRLGRHQHVSDHVAPPSTYIYMTWYWKDMRKGDKRSQCFVNAKLVTPIDQTTVGEAKTQVKNSKMRVFKVGKKYRSFGNKATIQKQSSWTFGLNWHGQDDPAPKDKAVSIREIGQLRLKCDAEDSFLSIVPTNPSAGAYVVATQGEGYEADDKSQYFYDPLMAAISPIPLPGNGMLRIGLQIGKQKYQLNVSSIQKLNDENPALNFCETSVFVTAL